MPGSDTAKFPPGQDIKTLKYVIHQVGLNPSPGRGKGANLTELTVQ